MNKTVPVDIVFLEKLAQFTKLAMTKIRTLESQADYHKVKQAADDLEHERYQQTVIKVADALYAADLEFIDDDFDRRNFIKRAMVDKVFLANTLLKLCKAADVADFGTLAGVEAPTKTAHVSDPVYNRAFGVSRRTYSLFD